MNNSLAEVYPELITEWSEKNLPLTPDDITFGSNKKVWRKGTCGHEWQTSVKARSNGEKCPICSGARVIAGINDLATTDSQLLSEWDYEQNKLKPTEVSRTSAKRAWWKCRHGHSWNMKINERTILNKGCRFCEQEYLSLFPALVVSYYSNKKGSKAELGSDRLLGVPLETYIHSEKLGNIPSIDYSWGEVDFVSRPLNEMSDEDMREWLMCWHEYNPLPDI